VNDKTVGNPKNLQFVEAAPDLQARAVPDVDPAILNGNYFLDAGYTLTDALIVEPLQDNPHANFLVTRTDNHDNPDAVKLNDLLHGDQTRAFIEQKWPGETCNRPSSGRLRQWCSENRCPSTGVGRPWSATRRGPHDVRESMA
jgi:ABC-type metal ion transport system substrate-binding protein